MGKSKVRRQLERQKHEALKQLQAREEELEVVKRRYSETIRAGNKERLDDSL